MTTTRANPLRRKLFRHRLAVASVICLAVLVVLAVTSIGVGPVPGWWPHGYATPEAIGPGHGAPSWSHPFGQDTIGIDYFALTMRGVQRSLLIAVVVGAVSTVVGTVVGALAGYLRGPTEAVLMRSTDVMLMIPTLVIAAVVGRRFGASGALALGLMLGLVTWMPLARIVRAEFLSIREKEFVEAARALGAGPVRIMVRHIVPNAAGVIVVGATLATAQAILLESALSYLNLGVRPPDTSLGLLIDEYQSAFWSRPWLFWWPGLFIIVIALAVTFIGDGLRDASDPRHWRGR